MKFKLVEIFESLQGEGRHSGRPAVFVRFAGCNLNCPWCDTDCTARFEATVEEVVREVSGYRARYVILTGGEPTLQSGMSELIAALKAARFTVAIETNGTAEPEWFKALDYIACSPKADFADRYDGSGLRRADEVRVVASSEAVVPFCERIHGLIAANDYYISPCDHNGEIDFASAKSVLSRLSGWSLSVQLHKILGFR